MVSWTKDSATSSSVGNSRCGNTPAQATISQMVPTTTNGKILLAMARKRRSLVERPAAFETAIVVAAFCIVRCSSQVLLQASCGGPVKGGLGPSRGQDNAL